MEVIVYKLLTAAALAFSLVGPAMAQSTNPIPACDFRGQPGADGEVQSLLKWQCAVATANAHRIARQARAAQAVAMPSMAVPTAKAATVPRTNPVVAREASVASPATRSDATLAPATLRPPRMSLDGAANTPHRPYTRIEDYWQDK